MSCHLLLRASEFVAKIGRMHEVHFLWGKDVVFFEGSTQLPIDGRYQADAVEAYPGYRRTAKAGREQSKHSDEGQGR